MQGRLATSSLRKLPSYFFSKNSTTPPQNLARTVVLKVKLNDKLIAFLFCEALLSCDYYDAKHYYAAASIQSINTSVTIVTTTLSFHERTILTTTLFTSVL